MMKKFTRLLITALFLVSLSSVCEAGHETETIPLYKLSVKKIIKLECIHGEEGLSIPIAERWNVTGASLTLKYTNSISLIKEISQLSVQLNGFTVAQTKLDPLSPEGTIEVDIPPDLIKAGYNHLTFSVSQHYKEKCENYCSSNLWTSIDLKKSVLKLRHDLNPVPLSLLSISDFLFDAKIFPRAEVNLITEDKTSENLTLAAVVASGVARRFDYREVKFNMSQKVKAKMDNVVIGDKAFVESFLSARGIEFDGIDGPFIKIMHLPGPGGTTDKTHALLLVTAADKDSIKIAAETFANMTFPFPGGNEMSVTGFSMPDIPLYGGRLVIKADKTYTFKTLKFDTTTFEGLNPSTREITFRLPADFLIRHNQTATLILTYAFGAGLMEESSLNVAINDKNVRAISLNNPGGDFIESYRIEIPTYLFKPGTNVLQFSPTLKAKAKECDLIQSGNLFITIFDISTLKFPSMSHFVELPNLELFMLNGFPLTRWPDGYESMVYLPETDDATVSSALSLLGLITQKNGYPLFGIKVSTELPSVWDGEMLVIGPEKSIPDSIKENAPLKLMDEAVVQYPVIASWEDDITFARSSQRSEIGSEYGALMQFQSPLMKGRSVFMVTASDSAALEKLSQALLDPGVQSNSKGDLAFIRLNPPDYDVYSLSVKEKFFTGKLGKISSVELFLHSSPYIYYGAIGALVLVFGTIIFLLLKWRKLRKMRNAGNLKDAF
jgi:hypothetical protein